jgi:cytochrome b involved in lipid metabolism
MFRRTFGQDITTMDVYFDRTYVYSRFKKKYQNDNNLNTMYIKDQLRKHIHTKRNLFKIWKKNMGIDMKDMRWYSVVKMFFIICTCK